MNEAPEVTLLRFSLNSEWLDEIGTVQAYLLDNLMYDEDAWNDFANEVFHHALRVV